MNEPKSQTSIEALDVTKVYWDGGKNLQVLKNVSLSVRKGEGVSILGPSGSGKTTLLNVLSGLDRPDSGRVFLEGTELSTLSETARAKFRNKRIGFVFQFYHLLPEFTALENVMLPGWVAGEKGVGRERLRQRASDLLRKVGLGGRMDHFPTELSGGEQQRVAIARALYNEPDILFCDEPTGNLDPRTGSEIIGILEELFRRDGKSVLIVTHDERIAKITDRVWDLVKSDWENPIGAQATR